MGRKGVKHDDIPQVDYREVVHKMNHENISLEAMAAEFGVTIKRFIRKMQNVGYYFERGKWRYRS